MKYPYLYYLPIKLSHLCRNTAGPWPWSVAVAVAWAVVRPSPSSAATDGHNVPESEVPCLNMLSLFVLLYKLLYLVN